MLDDHSPGDASARVQHQVLKQREFLSRSALFVCRHAPPAAQPGRALGRPP